MNLEYLKEWRKKKFIRPSLIVNIEDKNGSKQYEFVYIEETDYELFNDGVSGAVKLFHDPITITGE